MELNVLTSFLVIINSLREKIENEEEYIKDVESRIRMEMGRVDNLNNEKIKLMIQIDALSIENSTLKEIIKEKQSEIEKRENQTKSWMGNYDNLWRKNIELRRKTRKKRTH